MLQGVAGGGGGGGDEGWQEVGREPSTQVQGSAKTRESVHTYTDSEDLQLEAASARPLHFQLQEEQEARKALQAEVTDLKERLTRAESKADEAGSQEPDALSRLKDTERRLEEAEQLNRSQCLLMEELRSANWKLDVAVRRLKG